MGGPDHVEVARTLGHLGNAYGDLDDRKKMGELVERALIIQEAAFGKDHVETAMARAYVAKYLSKRCEVLRATNAMEQVVGAFQSGYGANHIWTQKASAQLQKIYRNSFVKPAGEGL